MTILEKITVHKKKEVEKIKRKKPMEQLKKSVFFNRECYSLYQSIKNTNGIIAEFKRKSPSKGIINDTASIENVVKGYQKAKVAAISILTDSHFFGGADSDLIEAKKHVNIPILRKDFIVNSYQIYQAKAIGADAILLIAAILTSSEIKEFTSLAHNLGMAVLFEVHTQIELEKYIPEIKIVGINNRNLNTFEVDFQNSIKLRNQLPKNTLKIAESGISDPKNIKMLKNHGFDGFLIGENFMKSKNPAIACKEFIQKIN